jgi:hypothetical protein
VVLTNAEAGAAFSAITNTIKDSYLGLQREDWVLHDDTLMAGRQKQADELISKIQEEINQTVAAANSGIDLSLFAGKYNDPWLGEVIISEKQGKLHFQSVRSPQLRGDMSFYKGNTFVVKWGNRSMNADAFADFDLDTEGKPDGFRMKAISPLTDFSYDFQDLNFIRKNN